MPKKYKVHTFPYFDISLAQIFDNKFEYSPEGALSFYNEVKEKVLKLDFLPESGKPLKGKYRAKIVRGCLLIYFFDEENVYVADIVDPTQHTKAEKYYPDL